MQLPIALNVIWGVIALLAVALFALAERKHWCVSRHGRRGQRISAVLLAVCFLFPCVSASDDILGLSTLHGNHDRAPAPSKTSVHLERVLQELETLQVSAVFVFVFTLCCVGLVIVSQFQNVARQLPCLIGRGPPSAV